MLELQADRLDALALRRCDDPGHFRRAFRAAFGITPTQFRRETLHSPARFAECGASSGV